MENKEATNLMLDQSDPHYVTTIERSSVNKNIEAEKNVITAPGTDLTNRIDFIALISAKDANPNSDPGNEGRPRQDFWGCGLITLGCIKHHIRMVLQKRGYPIYMQTGGMCSDGYRTPYERAKANSGMQAALQRKDIDFYNKDRLYQNEACSSWIDVRMFGGVFSYRLPGDREDRSAGILGPVWIADAHSVDPIITTEYPGYRKGEKTFVDFGLYVVRGGVDVFPAKKTGLSRADVDAFKEALPCIYTETYAGTRPGGFIRVEQVFWFEHDAALPKVTGASIYESLRIEAKNGRPESINDYEVEWMGIEGCPEPELLV